MIKFKIYDISGCGWRWNLFKVCGKDVVYLDYGACENYQEAHAAAIRAISFHLTGTTMAIKV